jgi:hypothetical protein
MPKPISADLLICEKVLIEGDGVMSAIRLVDIFYVSKAPDIPMERQGAQMSVLGMIKVEIGDLEEHEIEVRLVRPSGESSTIGEPQKVRMEPKEPSSPGGFNFVAPLGVIAKEMGVHYFVLMFDGQEVTRALFTLVERKPATFEP